MTSTVDRNLASDALENTEQLGDANSNKVVCFPSEAAKIKLDQYLALLAKWNRTYNLTAIRSAELMVSHHLSDSISVLPYLAGLDSLADIGSGAGLPGIPIAICRPDLTVTSIESNEKKAAFQRQVKIQLELKNISVQCRRVEQTDGRYDAVISRAFSDLSDFVRLAGHLSNRLLAMKGQYPANEIAELPDHWHVSAVHEILVPDLDAERHLIVLEKQVCTSLR